MLLRWTESGGQLSGAIQVVSGVASAQGADVTVFNGTVRGTKNGSSYSFIVDKPVALLGSSAMDGVLKGDVLSVQVPLDSGGFGSFSLQRTTIEKFNASVAKLKNNLEQQSSSLSAQQQQAVHLKEATANFATIQNLLPKITPDLPQLQRSITLASNRLDDLRKRNATLQQLSKEGKCSDFNSTRDKDTLARPDLDEAIEVLAEQIEFLASQSNKLETTLKTYTVAKGAYAAAKGNAALLPNDRVLLQQAESVSSALNKQLDVGRQLLSTLTTDVEQLARENDGLTCS